MILTCNNISRRWFKGNDSGTVILEFALIAPVFFLIFMAIIEMGLVFFTQSVLEGALAHGARIGMTGFSGVLSREQYILREIDRYTGGYLDDSQMTITMFSYSSFVNIGIPEPCITPSPCPGDAGINFVDVNGNGVWDDDQGRAGPGNPNDIVLYRVNYNWRMFTPLISNIFGDSAGVYKITAASTVKNEAFQ